MFPCTNNAAEYEALLHGLRMAKEMNLSRVRFFGDSDLVSQQVSGTGNLRIHSRRLIDERWTLLLVNTKVIKLSMLIERKMKRQML